MLRFFVHLADTTQQVFQHFESLSGNIGSLVGGRQLDSGLSIEFGDIYVGLSLTVKPLVVSDIKTARPSSSVTRAIASSPEASRISKDAIPKVCSESDCDNSLCGKFVGSGGDEVIASYGPREICTY